MAPDTAKDRGIRPPSPHMVGVKIPQPIRPRLLVKKHLTENKRRDPTALSLR